MTPKLSATAGAIRASVFSDLAPRIEARARSGGSLVALHIGDTHLAPPRAARFGGVARDDFEPALYGYGAITSTPELRAACASRASSRLGAVDPARHVLVGCGATHAIFCAVRAVLDEGDDVLLASPYWPLSHGILSAAGARPVEVPLTSRLYRDPSLDAGEVLEAAATPRTRAVYVITPNNPDGKVLSRRDLEAVARVARTRNWWVVADEVYADYTYDREHVSIASLDGMRDRTITASSFSKSHALAGARVGYVVAPEEVVAAARKVSTHTVFNVPVVAQRVATAAMADDAAWIGDARREYRAARDVVVEALRGAPVDFSVAEGGSYLFVDFARALGDRPLLALLERAIDHGVLLAPGEAFGAGFERCARLCFTSVPRAVLVDGVARLRRALDDVAR